VAILLERNARAKLPSVELDLPQDRAEWRSGRVKPGPLSSNSRRSVTSLIGPRPGDVEDDASSTKQRSLLAIAGSLLAEISLLKLALAWVLLIVLPGLLLGLSPLIISGWLSTLSRKIAEPLYGTWPLLVLALVVALGWIFGRPLFRAAEQGFWSLNSLGSSTGLRALSRGSATPNRANDAKGRC
jgi:hypothetical protein